MAISLTYEKTDAKEVTWSMPHEKKMYQIQDHVFVFCWQSSGRGIMHGATDFWWIESFQKTL